MADVTAPTPPVLGSIRDVADAVTQSVVSIYDAKARIAQAKGNAAITAAQQRSAVGFASVGLPAPNILLFAGLGLAALLILRKR